MNSSPLKKPVLSRIEGNVIHERFCHIVKPSYLHPSSHADFIFPPWDHPTVFGNNHPVNIEYCSGNGSWIASRAAGDPAVNWVAVEMKFGRARKIWSKIHRFNLRNLFVVNGEGEYASQTHFPKNSVDKIYINFPDPWPKRYHAKNRLIKPEFVQAMAELLKEGGSIIFVTDDVAYSEWTLKIFKDSPYFTATFSSPYYVTEWPNYGNSYFENLWREKGLEIRYHEFTKTQSPPSKSSRQELAVIDLDATQKSILNWQKEIELAQSHISTGPQSEGPQIVWNLDFGLFNRLRSPLSNQLQFQALTLAIKHFSESIWSEFSSASVGVCLYRGAFDLHEMIAKDHTSAFCDWIQDRFPSVDHFYKEIDFDFPSIDSMTVEALLNESNEKAKFILDCFCRDVALDYLKQLARQLPYGAEPLIEISEPENLSPIEKHIFFNAECFKPLKRLGECTLSFETNVGICLPPVHTFSIQKIRERFDSTLSQLSDKNISYRIIPEESLINSLEGLDELYVCPEEVSLQGKRQLQGFSAAGGRIISI